MLERYNVSRPTLRQAAALVAQEQLLEVRRGVGGGYIARRPTSRAVAHMAAIYLKTRGTGLEDVLSSIVPVRAELARLAAVNLDEESRRTFTEYLKTEIDQMAEGGHYRAFLQGERAFSHVLGAASRNPVMWLFLEILFDLCANLLPEEDIYFGRPERIAEFRERKIRIVEAILGGDPRLAELLSLRASERNRQWMLEDRRRQIVLGRDVEGGLDKFDGTLKQKEGDA